MLIIELGGGSAGQQPPAPPPAHTLMHIVDIIFSCTTALSFNCPDRTSGMEWEWRVEWVPVIFYSLETVSARFYCFNY